MGCHVIERCVWGRRLIVWYTRLLAHREAYVAKIEPNWPSKCYPLLHHDIAMDIPERSQSVVRQAYFALLGNVT